MTAEILIVDQLTAYCPSSIGGGFQTILDNVSLTVSEGDILGVVGETGAGKSVLIDAVGRNLKPPIWFAAKGLAVADNGRLEDLLAMEEDDLSKIWGKAIAFIPPNARERLNPILSVGKQLSNIIMTHSKMSRREARQKVIELFKMVQMPDPEKNYDSYPHELSGGMAQRVVISVALFMAPKLLLADEPTKGLDVTIQKQVLDLMAKLLNDSNSASLLATRDLGIVANYCNKVAVLCNGHLVEYAPMRDFFKKPAHPYSKYLLDAAFASHGMESHVDSSAVASKNEMESRAQNGCRFSGRCAREENLVELCSTVNPPTVFLSEDHFVKCHRIKGGQIG